MFTTNVRKCIPNIKYEKTKLHISNYALIFTQLSKKYEYLILGKSTHICGVSYHPAYHIKDGWLNIQHLISSWGIDLIFKVTHLFIFFNAEYFLLSLQAGIHILNCVLKGAQSYLFGL